jgi:REP element-mobilizing transposase RayT
VSERHERREAFRASEPVHVVMRCAKRVGSLRRRHLYHAIRKATAAMLKRDDCRIVHASVQGTHLHLVVEASDRMSLARGMQAFQISAAQHINRALSRRSRTMVRGTVFTDRYHAVVLRKPRQVRNALSYVLNNWRRHGEHARGEATAWQIDRYSSAIGFDGWKERQGRPFVPPEDHEPLVVRDAKVWLLTTGWRMHGLISIDEVPGSV